MNRLFLLILIIAFGIYVNAQEKMAPGGGGDNSGIDSDVVEENIDIIDELEERLDVIETSTLVDKLSFSVDFKTVMNNFVYRDDSKSNVTKGRLTKNGDSLFAAAWRGRIKAFAQMGRDIKLVVWLTTFKTFAESGPERHFYTAKDHDGKYAALPNDATLLLDRMYFDWFLTDWLALTVGRGPLTDGTPMDLQNDTVSLSSFPSTAINMPMDGFFLTILLDPLMNLKKGFFRIGYIPSTFFEDTPHTNWLMATEKGLSNSFFTQLTFDIPGLKGINFSYVAGYMMQLKMNSFKYSNEDLGLSDVTMTHTPGGYGTMLMQNVQIDMRNVLDFPIDIWIAATATLVTGGKKDGNEYEGYFGMHNSTGTVDTPLLSIYGELDEDARWGYMGNVGIRYTTPWEMRSSKVKIGADFIYSNKYFKGFYIPEPTGFSRYNNLGYSAEAYVMFPIYRRSNIKLGGIYMHSTHANGIEGFIYEYDKNVKEGIPEIDETIYNFYVMINGYF